MTEQEKDALERAKVKALQSIAESLKLMMIDDGGIWIEGKIGTL